MRRSLFAFCWLWSAHALAHDQWLLPEQFRAAPNAPVPVRLYVGERFEPEEERPYERAKFQSIDAFSRAGKLALASSENQKPLLSIATDSTVLIAAEKAPQTIILEPSRFDAYLHEEGLDAIVNDRATRNEKHLAGRERYTRYLKTVVRRGSGSEEVVRRTVGQKLEIVLDRDPAGLGWGADLPIHILFEGKPLANATVESFARDGTSFTQKRRTDASGATSFVAFPGQWHVRLVHMRRCTATCNDVDWESFWASYTFEVR